MKLRFWTEEEVARLLRMYELTYQPGAIAATLGRSESSVRLKMLSLGLSSRRITKAVIEEEASSVIPHPEEASIDEEAIKLRAERELEVREQRAELRTQVDDAKREILEQRIIDDFHRHLCNLPQSISVRLPVVPPTDHSSDVAVLVVGDVHIGQVVDPDESEGLGTYNPSVMIARVHHLQQEAIRILSSHPVEKLLLLFAGDMLHGQLRHSLEDDLTLPIALQAVAAMAVTFTPHRPFSVLP